MAKKIKIFIAIISNRERVPKFFMNSMINLFAKTKEKYDVEMGCAAAVECNLMRNYACKVAEEQYDYIYMVDEDMEYPADSIIKLMKHKKDFVTGSATMRSPPYNPTQYKKWRSTKLSNPKNLVRAEGKELIKIGCSGVCGALIKTSVFKKLKYPFFQIKYNKFPNIVGGDVMFCKQLRDKKIEMYLDPTVYYGHLAKSYIVSQNGTKIC